MPNLEGVFKARRNLILMLVALAVVLAVGIAACGGDDDASDATEPPAAEKPTDFTADPVEDPPSPPPPEDPPDPVTTETETVPDDLPKIKVKGKALKKGVENKRVEQLQVALIYVGLLEEGSADGNFGSGTKRAVQAFQLEKGLKSDGVAGQKTIRAINKSVKKGERFDDFTGDDASADTGDTTGNADGNGSGDDSAGGETEEPS